MTSLHSRLQDMSIAAHLQHMIKIWAFASVAGTCNWGVLQLPPPSCLPIFMLFWPLAVHGPCHHSWPSRSPCSHCWPSMLVLHKAVADYTNLSSPDCVLSLWDLQKMAPQGQHLPRAGPGQSVETRRQRGSTAGMGFSIKGGEGDCGWHWAGAAVILCYTKSGASTSLSPFKAHWSIVNKDKLSSSYFIILTWILANSL